MAGPQHDTAEFEPRRRIIGAVILVTVAFVVLSLVLQNKAPEDRGLSSTATPGTRVVVAPVPSPAPPGAPAVTTSQPMAKPAAAIVPAKPVSTPAAATHKAPVAHKHIVPAKSNSSPPPRSSSGKWMVQVGTFAESANARRLGKKLEAIHFPVHLAVVSLEKSRAVRVQAGPFSSKAKAMAARDEIEKRLGMRGVVFARK